MNTTESNKVNDSIIVKAAQSRSIPIDELTFQNLTGNELKVFMAIRFESDYAKRCSEVKISISYIAKSAKVSERKVYEALNKLEYDHFLIQRLNYQHNKRGQTNSYLVSRDYAYYKPLVQSQYTPAENDIGVQSQYTPADSAVTPAENDILLDQEYNQESSQYFLEEKNKKSLNPNDYQETYYRQDKKEATISEQLNQQTDYKNKELGILTNLVYEQKITAIIKQCARDEECQKSFNAKFSGYDVTYQRMLEECTSHYTTQNKLFDRFKFLSWINKCNPELKGYKTKAQVIKENTFSYANLTKKQIELVQQLAYERLNPDRPAVLRSIERKEAERLESLLQEANNKIPYEVYSEEEKKTINQMNAVAAKVIINKTLNTNPIKESQPIHKYEQLRNNSNITLTDKPYEKVLTNMLGRVPSPNSRGMIALPVGGYTKEKAVPKKPSISLAERLKSYSKEQ